ncbi:Bug family tripartite tricarboxylate transporter substrate binding protein [Pararoseomonas indoligenes]|uniref:Tripartite tricarboxylate transporter substrate binding protein n=1 Tax=Roseomonas indoligenes TaxID=2820811 RepID=A0A940MSW0_9PROT|nr:tripartite tricarboxylate transporter substrate binding protein [Pararoseomonas indoligenes]MBP0491271.1 tripartite tricarboxylate transporter substrate binding protein [Pararoseomonas indoligenes]
MNRRDLLRASLAGTALSGLAAPALRAQGTNQGANQGFDHTIRIIVPNAPGGTSDILARLIAPDLTRILGQTVVIENRAGAAGNIGADAVAKSTPDGHTLLLMDVSTLAINPTLFPRMPFDVQKDLAPVSMLIYAPYLLATKSALPVRDAASFAAYAKANPGLNVANAGVGSLTHLTSAELGTFLGGHFTQVPYRGGAPALVAVTTGEADLIVNGATATIPFVKNNQMRGIAVSGEHRLEGLPEVPTFKELGWPMADSGTWQGIMVQGNTPKPLVERLHAALREVVTVPTIAARFKELGAEPRTDGPEAFREWLGRSTTTFGRIVQANNIKAE